MKVIKNLLLLSLFISMPIFSNEEAKDTNQYDVERWHDKCVSYKKNYEELLTEWKAKHGTVNNRMDFLKRELPRAKEMMDYYCNKFQTTN